MATVTDTLVTKHVLDQSEYLKGAQDILKATGGIGQTLSGLITPQTAVAAGAAAVAAGFAAIATATIAATKAGIDYGVTAIQQAASFDALKKALQVYAGSAEETERQIERLKVVAEAPGLGFREAVQGSVRLQAIGFSARGAERTLKALGNALASSGGGKAELDGIVMALAQIIGKGTVSAEEINQIAERFPGIRQIMTETFGTASAEIIQKTVGPEGFITGMIAGLEKLPQSSGSAQTSIENFSDAIDQVNIAVGTSLIGQLSKDFQEITTYIGFVAQSGVLDRIATNFASIFGIGKDGAGSGMIAAADKFLTLMEMGSYVLKEAFSFVTNNIKTLLTLLEPLPVIGTLARGAKAGIAGLEIAGAYANVISAASGGLLGTGGMGAFEQYKQDRKNQQAIDAEAAKKSPLLNPKGPTPEQETAKNTKKMVELQQKGLDIQSTLMGGGAFSRQGFSQVNLSRIIGGSRMERGIRMAVVGMVEGIGDFGVQQNRWGY